jgi:sarcosine oxidase subunit delta
MRIACPLCGERDRREFTVKGAALPRPAAGSAPGDWDAFLHLRENPAGVTRELWHHELGCGAWLVVSRDTVSHAVHEVQLAEEAKLGGGA